MSLFFSFWWSPIFFSLLFCVFGYYVYFKLVASKYWKKRNVFHLESSFLLGNQWQREFTGYFNFFLEKTYRELKDKKLVGFWSLTSPQLLVTDIELIRRILIRDFAHFVDRNNNVNLDTDPLAGHLFNMKGAEWRNLRVKLTPTFTSGKMKMMFPTMVRCGLQLQQYLEKHALRGDELEMRELFARFTTDIISSCAFGIETNTLKNPDSEFRTYSKKIFTPSSTMILKFLIFKLTPWLQSALKIRLLPREVTNFFINLVKETTEYREKNNIKRNDFLDLLMQLKNKGYVDGADADQQKLQNQDQKFTLTEAAAQAFVFFVAGFETSSTTLSFAFHELAVNPDVQEKLQQEIDSYLKKSNGEITYDVVMEMEYLDWVIQETLRKYPPVPALVRKCTKEYRIPEMDITLEEGTVAFISVLGIHKDPQFFPNPEKFDPTRFSPEEKSKRDRLTSLAFGEGPRNCIGSRFGLLQTKVGIVSILSQYNVEVSENTAIPIVFNKKTFLLNSVGGIQLKIVNRKDKCS